MVSPQFRQVLELSIQIDDTLTDCLPLERSHRLLGFGEQRGELALNTIVCMVTSMTCDRLLAPYARARTNMRQINLGVRWAPKGWVSG
jgi:hypothetical protein